MKSKSEVNVKNKIPMIRELDSLPNYSMILTDSGQSLAMSKAEQDKVAVLDLGGGSVCIVVTKRFLSDPKYINLKLMIKKRGLTIGKTCGAVESFIPTIYKSFKERGESKGLKKTGISLEREADKLFEESLSQRASDIHIWYNPDKAWIDFRLDGEISKYKDYDPEYIIDLCNVIYSVMPTSSEMDASQFNPKAFQNAAFNRLIGGENIKLRFASTPKHPDGFKAVLRLLPVGKDSGKIVPFRALGYGRQHVTMLELAMRKSVGLIVIAGVTGSGKSTTLKNAVLQTSDWNNGAVSIYTVEDPPEYDIPVACQIPVIRSKDDPNPFASALRACMRLDPDIMMVGEIRDNSTAEVMKGAVTSGHQVLTTVHASSAFEIISRLEYFGIHRSEMTTQSFISCLVYQKLVPVTCKKCGVGYHDAKNNGIISSNDSMIFKRLSHVIDTLDVDKILFRNKKGCDNENCRNGITGRTLCCEVVIPDYEMLEMFRCGKDIEAFRHWRKSFDGRGVVGMRAQDHAILKMKEGILCPLSVESAFEQFGLQSIHDDGVIESSEIEELTKDKD